MSLTLRQSCPSLRRLARAAFGHSSFLSYFLVLSVFVCGSSLELSSTLQTVATLVRVIEIGVLRGEASR